MSIARAIAGNTLSVAAARIIGSVFTFATTAFIARTLGPEGYGNLAAVLAFVYLFSALADFGLYSVLTREISLPGADERKLAGNMFAMRLVSLTCFLTLGVAAILFFPYSDEVKMAAPLAAVFYFSLSAGQVLMGIFQKHFRMHFAALSELAGRAAHFAVSFLLYLVHGSLLLFLASLALSALLQFALEFLWAQRIIRFGIAFDVEVWKRTVKIAFPIALSLVFTLAYFRLDTVLLSLLAPNPARDTGIYHIAYKFLESMIFFPAMFVGILMPLFAASAKTDHARFQRLFQKAWDVLVLAAVPMVAGGFFLATPIVVLLGGGEFRDAAVPFRILLGATGIIFVATLFGNAVIALDLQKKAVPVYFAGMLFNVAANIVLIPRFSYIAAAATTLLTELLVLAGLAYIVFRAGVAFPRQGSFLRAAVAAFFMVVPLGLFAEKTFASTGLTILIPSIIGGAALYFCAVFLMGGITKNDIALLFRKA